MSTLIVPIVKSPHRAGRIGPDKWQDWYAGLKIARNLLESYPSSQIAIISAFSQDGIAETNIYVETLRKMGVQDPLVIKEGFETISQIELAKKLARERGDQLILVSTFLHRPRVGYYAGKGVLHRTAWGIPKLKEIPRDISMIILAPLIDWFGYREWFLKKVNNRRKAGNL